MARLTVAAPAADRALVDLDRVKSELGIADATQDGLLSSWIRDDSDRVCAACGVAPDQARRRSFRVEGVSVTYGAAEARDRRRLLLPWRLPVDVDSLTVTEDGVLLDGASVALDPDSLVLSRVAGACDAPWRGAVTVGFTAGWDLADVPAELVAAVLRLVRLRWETLDRDLTLRSQSIVGGFTEEYLAVGAGVPADVLASLRGAGLVCPVQA